MRVEVLGRGDASAIKALLVASNLPIGDLDESPVRFLGLRGPQGLTGIVGVELLGDEGLLRSLAVVPDQRGVGLGIELVREAEAAAAQSGVRDLYLLTTTAEQFFRKRGYAVLPRAGAPASVEATAEFRDICPSTAVFMHKALGPTRT